MAGTGVLTPSVPAAKPDVFKSRSPLTFFALVFGLSIPFWLLGAATDLQWMPGLSVSVLMAFCPMAAALVLVYRENKAAGLTELMARSLDFKRIKAKRWYVPILLLMPGVSVVVVGLMHWMGMPLPAPQVSVVPALLMFLAFLLVRWAKSWAGRDTCSTRCRLVGVPCGPASLWGSLRSCGISCRYCSCTGHRHGSPGGACTPWRSGS